MDTMAMSALDIGRALKNKKLGCEELTRSLLDAIRRAEPQINAYITISEEEALAQAKTAQTILDAGETTSLLTGVPMALKDNICTEGVPTTCGSKMLESFRPPYDATATERLKAAGAVILGKLNMDEFAMGGSTETSYFGPTANPWDLERVPGGSSGGSAAAVAAGEAVYTLGSDTGGSIRQPCSFCGVSGIKPTYGAVSRYGLVAFASSLDQIGPVGRTVEDCSAVLKLISGFDRKDSTSTQREEMDFGGSFSGEAGGLRIGIPRGYFGPGLDNDVGKAVLEGAAALERLGATVEEFDLPLVDYAVPAYYVLACTEASSNLSRYDGIKYGFRAGDTESLEDVYRNSRSEGFGMEVKRRIMLGSFVLSSGYYDAYYKKGLQARELIRKAFAEAFESYDIILSPAAPTTAYRLGENIADPLKMYLGDIYTVSVNLAGLPAVTVPCGFGDSGMPVGMQLIGKAFSEPVLVRAAHAFQRNTDFHMKRPVFSKGGEQA